MDIENDLPEIEKEKKTTRKALVEARKSQEKYRDDLLDLGKSCSVSGFSIILESFAY